MAANTPFSMNTPGVVPTKQIFNRLNAIDAFLSSNAINVKSSGLLTIPTTVAVTNLDTGITIPANSLITSLGVFFTENATATGSSVLSIAFGPTSGDTSLVAVTALNGAGENIVLNQLISTSNGASGTSNGTAPAIAPGAASYYVNAGGLFLQTTVATNVLSATCDVKVIVEYLEISNS